MDILGILTGFTKDLLKLPESHPLRKRFEQAINEYSLERWGRPVIRDPQDEINPAEATIQELRNAASTLFQEAERLEMIPDAKKLFAIRKPGHKEFLFIDKSEKDVRYWALQNPSDEHRMYEEWWVNDPIKNGARRCIKRLPMDIPTITAKNQVAEEQKRSQRNQA